MLASLEQHRETNADVELFYNFFVEKPNGYQIKELLFYLYVRSLAEQLLSVMFVKLPSNQDIRSVFINKQKCLKISRVYYQNAISAQSHLDIDSPSTLDQ